MKGKSIKVSFISGGCESKKKKRNRSNKQQQTATESRKK